MKLKLLTPKIGNRSVAPFVGAWIETLAGSGGGNWELVAPFVGAWIETPLQGVGNPDAVSLLS